MKQSVVVGIDIGSSRIKAAAYAPDGSTVALEAIDTPLLRSDAGDDFPVFEMLAAVRDVVGALRVGSIAAVGMTSMGEVGTVLTARGLAPLAFPSWYDDRGRPIVEALEETWGPERLRDLTGRHFRTTSTIAKLAHVEAHGGGVPRGAFVGLCGAVAYELTGQAWQEAGLAATSGAYDLVHRRYLREVWASTGLGHVEPVAVRPPGFSAPARGERARELRIEQGAPVVIAGHDHPVAAVGSGVLIGDVFDSMGTGEAIISALSPDAPFDPEILAAHLDRDPDLSFEFWPATGAPLAVWERMRPGLAMRTFLDASGSGRDALDAAAPPPRAATAFSPDDLDALQAGRGIEGPHDARAWGGLIDAYALLAERGNRLVREVADAHGPTVLTGGGMRSRRWREAKLVLGTPPIEVSTVTEAATRGCAAIAATAIAGSRGWWRRPEEMPGVARVPVSSPEEMDAAMTGAPISN